MNLTDDDLLALFYFQRYGFLTIQQTVQVIDKNRSYQNIGRRLREMKQAGYVGVFGGKYGGLNVPKVYYIQKQGYEYLIENKRIPRELVGEFKKRKKPTWTTETNHRIDLVSCFLSLENSVRKHEHLNIDKTFIDYNRTFINGSYVAETKDFIKDKNDDSDENRIVPDGAFVLSSLKTGNKALFMVEMDRNNETIVSHITKNKKFALQAKIKKYVRYLESGNYIQKYAKWGKFDHFVLNFITTSEKHLEYIRENLSFIPKEYSANFLFNIHKPTIENYFNQNWNNGNRENNQSQGLFD